MFYIILWGVFEACTNICTVNCCTDTVGDSKHVSTCVALYPV